MGALPKKRGNLEIGRIIPMDEDCSLRAVKNNLPTPSGEVEESEGPDWMRAIGIIPANPY
jgi:hypothetical protein